MPKMNPSRRVVAEVARRLRAERLRRGISMTKLADESGLSQQMISYVERGMRSPTLDTLLRMAGVLKVDLWMILQSASKSRNGK
jgi:XRE family transcriptional regulator of biofilm formation